MQRDRTNADAGRSVTASVSAKQYTGRRKTVIVILDADVLGQEAQQQELNTYHNEDAVSNITRNHISQ
jgi:hypothetical protein